MSQRRRSTRKIEETIRHLEKNFQCAICLELMKNPVMTKCGHIFCRHCLHMMIGHKQEAPCPLCKVPFTKRSLKTLMQWNLIVQSVGNLIQSFEADSGVLFSPSRLAAAVSSPRKIAKPQPLEQPLSNPQLEQRQQPEPLPLPSRRPITKQAQLVQGRGGKRRIELEGIHVAVLDDSEESQPQNTGNQEDCVRTNAQGEANEKKAQEELEISSNCNKYRRSTRSKERVKNAPNDNSKELLQFIAKGSLEVHPAKRPVKSTVTKEGPLPSTSTDNKDTPADKFNPPAMVTCQRPSQDGTRSRTRRGRRKATQEEQPVDGDVIIEDIGCQSNGIPQKIQIHDKKDHDSKCKPQDEIADQDDVREERTGNVAKGLMTPESQPWKTNRSVVENHSLQSVTKHKIQKWFKEQKTPVSINLSPTQTCSESLHEVVCENAFEEDPLAAMAPTEAADEKPVVVLDSDQESYHTGEKLIIGEKADVIVEEFVKEVDGVRLTHRTRRAGPKLPQEEEMPQLTKQRRGRLRTTSNSRLTESINQPKVVEQQDLHPYQVEPVLFDLSQRDPVVAERFIEPELQNANVSSTSKASNRHERSMLKPVTRTYGRSVTPSKLKKSTEDESFANAKTPPAQRAKFFVARGEKTPVRQKIATVDFDAGSPEDPYAFRTSQTNNDKKAMTKGKAKAKKKKSTELNIIPVPRNKGRKEKMSDEMVKETRLGEEVKDDGLSSSQAEIKSIEEMLSHAEEHELLFSQQVRDMEKEARLERQNKQQEGPSACAADTCEFEDNKELPESVLENEGALQSPRGQIVASEQNKNRYQDEMQEEGTSETQNKDADIELNIVSKGTPGLVQEIVQDSEEHHVDTMHVPTDDVINENMEVSTVPESEEITESKAVLRKRSRRRLVQEEPPRQKVRLKGQSEQNWLGVQEMARDLVPQTRSLKLKKISSDKRSLRSSRRLKKGQEDKKDLVVDLTQDEPIICDVDTIDSRQDDRAENDVVAVEMQKATSSQKESKSEPTIQDGQMNPTSVAHRRETENYIDIDQKAETSKNESEPDNTNEESCISIRKVAEDEKVDGEEQQSDDSPQRLVEKISAHREDPDKVDSCGHVEDEMIPVGENDCQPSSMDEVCILNVSHSGREEEGTNVEPNKETVTASRGLGKKDGYEDVLVQLVTDDIAADETESQIKAGVKGLDDGGTQPFNFVNSNETTSFVQHSQNLSGTGRSQRRTFSLGTNSPVDSKKRKTAPNSISEDGDEQILKAVAQALGSDSLKNELVDTEELEIHKETSDNTKYEEVPKGEKEGCMETMDTCENAPPRSIDVEEEPIIQVVEPVSQKITRTSDESQNKLNNLGYTDHSGENVRSGRKRGNSRSKLGRKKKKTIQEGENESLGLQAPSQDKRKSTQDVSLLTSSPVITIPDSAECNGPKPEFVEPTETLEIKITTQGGEPKSEINAQSLTYPPQSNTTNSAKCKDHKDHLLESSSCNQVKEPEFEVQEIHDSVYDTALQEHQNTSKLQFGETIVIKSQNTQSYESSQSESLFKTSTLQKTASQHPDEESYLEAGKSQTQDLIPGTLEQEQNIPVRRRLRKTIQRLESLDEVKSAKGEKALVSTTQNRKNVSSQGDFSLKDSTLTKIASQNPNEDGNQVADNSQTQDLIPGTLEQEQSIPVRRRLRKSEHRLESPDEEVKSANGEKALVSTTQNRKNMSSQGDSSLKDSTLTKIASQNPNEDGNQVADNSQTQDMIPGTLEQEQNISAGRKSRKLQKKTDSVPDALPKTKEKSQNKKRNSNSKRTIDVQAIDSDASSDEDERVTPRCGRRAVRGLAARSDPKLQLEIAQMFADCKSTSPQINDETKSSQGNVMMNSPILQNSNKSKLVIPDTPDESLIQPRLSWQHNQDEENVRKSPLFLVADTPAGEKPSPRRFPYGIRKSLSPIQPVVTSIAETPFISKEHCSRNDALDDTFGGTEHVNSESFVLSPTPQATSKSTISAVPKKKIAAKSILKEVNEAVQSNREEATNQSDSEEAPKVKEEKVPPPISYVDENGRVIVRALSTSYEHPVEIEERKTSEKEEIDAVLKNVEEDLQMSESTKREPNTSDHNCVDSDDDDLILPSLEPSRQGTIHQAYLTISDGSETEPEEEIIKPRRKSHQNLIEDDMTDDEDDIETASNKSHTLDMTSSSAFSSQSDTHGTEQREYLEGDCVKIREEIARVEAQLAVTAVAPSAVNAVGEGAEASDEETCEARYEDDVVEETCEGGYVDDKVVEGTFKGRKEDIEVEEETYEGRDEDYELVEGACEGRNENDAVEEISERREMEGVLEETYEGRSEDEQEEPYQELLEEGHKDIIHSGDKAQQFLLAQQSSNVENKPGVAERKGQQSSSAAELGGQEKLDEDDLRLLQDHQASAQPSPGHFSVVGEDRNGDGNQHNPQSSEQVEGDDSCTVVVGYRGLLPRSLDFSGKDIKNLSGKSVKVIADSLQGLSQGEQAQQQETLDPCGNLSQKSTISQSQKSTISQSQKSTVSQSQQSNKSHDAEPGSPLPPTPPNKADLQMFRRQSLMAQKTDSSPTSFLNKYKSRHSKSLDDAHMNTKCKRKLDVHDEEKPGKVAKSVIKVKEEKDENASVPSSGTAKLSHPKQVNPLQPKMSPNISSDGSFSSNEIELPSRPHWCFVVSGVKKMRIKARIQKLQQLVGAKESQRITPSVTHLIVGPADPTKDLLVCQRTLKYFQAIAARKWVVSVQWAVDSIAKGQLLLEDDYEIHGDTSSEQPHDGPKRSRLEGGTLFRQFEMHCVGDFTNITRDEMRSLVESCGGSTVQDPLLFSFEPQKRQLIIVEPSSTLDLPVLRRLYQKYGVTILSKDWVLDSIGSYRLQRSTDYAINLNPESQCTY